MGTRSLGKSVFTLGLRAPRSRMLGNAIVLETLFPLPVAKLSFADKCASRTDSPGRVRSQVQLGNEESGNEGQWSRQSGERTRPRVLAMTPSSSRTFQGKLCLGKVRFLSLRKSIAARAPQSAREGVRSHEFNIFRCGQNAGLCPAFVRLASTASHAIFTVFGLAWRAEFPDPAAFSDRELGSRSRRRPSKGFVRTIRDFTL